MQAKDNKKNPVNKFGERVEGVVSSHVTEHKRRVKAAEKWTLSLLVYIIAYVCLCAFTLLTIYLNDRSGWLGFIKENVPAMVFLAVSLFLVYASMFFYYIAENKKALFSAKDSVCIFLVLGVTIVCSYFTGRYLDVLTRPVILAPLLIYFLRGRREAAFINTVYAVTMFLIDAFTNFSGRWIDLSVFASFLISAICGTLAVFFAGFIRSRIRTIVVGFFLCVPMEIIVTIYTYISRGTLASVNYVENIAYGAVGMLVSVLLLLSLLPFFEIAFSALTVFRLRELTSFDVKLLKRLREEAPATFDHSRVVAQFAEMCAANIGENAELARAAAYYHDVGKLSNPLYFTENQNGTGNPHDYLPPEVSAAVIRKHTVYGKQLIYENRLPDYFGEVALRHHGTMPIRYFYIKAKTLDGEEVNIDDYSYQDSKPLDKITAIIMLCDACEANIRSFRDNVNRQRSSGGKVTAEAVTNGIQKIIKKIVDERMELDQFSECDMTMKELGIIQTSILNCSTGVYHGRIAYPELNLRRKRE